MLLTFKIEDFNGKEGTLKAEHTSVFPSKPSFRLKSSSYLFIFLSFPFKGYKKHRLKDTSCYLVFCM